MRFGKAVPLIALAALPFANGSVLADPSEQLEAALIVCTSPPQAKALAAEKLIEAGWIADSDIVGTVLWSSNFAFNLKLEDIAYSLDNATMWAELVGGPGVSGDQHRNHGFIGGEARLAVLGVETAKGHCFLNGGLGLLDYLKSKTTLEEITSAASYSRLSGSIGDRTVEVVVLNRAQLQPLISESKPQYVDPANFVFDDVNIFISPAMQEAQK